MLFPYVYVPHRIERMHRFVNFIFYEVWCRAPKTRPYAAQLFDRNPALREIVDALTYGHSKEGDAFLGRIQAIYEEFADLQRSEISKVKRWYQANNDIESICKNSTHCRIARYADIAKVHPKLSELLASFFKNLSSSDLLGLKAIRDQIGEIDDHYKAFGQQNGLGVCPFCGISTMFGPNTVPREAYDHYLPKSLYPFNSINFRNLVPTCHHCNSAYKTIKDLAYQAKDPAGSTHRRRVFYPYRTTPQPIEVSMTLAHGDFAALKPDQIEIAFGPDEVREEINTWLDVYGVEERYKDFLLTGSGARYWWEQALSEWRGRGETIDSYLEIISKRADKHPYIEKNFLHKAFLNACAQRGLLEASTSIATASSAEK